MNNGRFAIALHILTLLEKANGELVSSSYLAGSININPAMVRKELLNLRNHGFVNSKEGKNGGVALAMSGKEISLGAIYESVRQVSLLGNQKNSPNPKCMVGRDINKHLEQLYGNTELILIEQLNKQNLAAFAEKFE